MLFRSEAQSNDGVRYDGTPNVAQSIPAHLTAEVANDPNNLKIKVSDLTTVSGPKQGAADKLLQLANIHTIMPINAAPTLQYRHKAKLTGYSKHDPANMEVPSVLHVDINPRGINLIPTSNNRDPILLRNGKKNYSCIFAIHKTSCICVDAVAGNNYPEIFSGQICHPPELSQEYETNPDIIPPRNLTGLPRKAANPSNVYASAVDSLGSILPRLLRRQPFTKPLRSKTRNYQPPFSNTDFLTNDKVARALYTAMCRPEFKKYTVLWSQDSGAGDDDNYVRWTDPTNIPNPDIAAYNKLDNLEDVVINSALIQPFKDILLCPLCNTAVSIDNIIDNIIDFITHLLDEHLPAFSEIGRAHV